MRDQKHKCHSTILCCTPARLEPEPTYSLHTPVLYAHGTAISRKRLAEATTRPNRINIDASAPRCITGNQSEANRRTLPNLSAGFFNSVLNGVPLSKKILLFHQISRFLIFRHKCCCKGNRYVSFY